MRFFSEAEAIVSAEYIDNTSSLEPMLHLLGTCELQLRPPIHADDMPWVVYTCRDAAGLYEARYWDGGWVDFVETFRIDDQGERQLDTLYCRHILN